MKPIVEQLMQLRALKREIELERGRIARLRTLAAYGCRSGEAVQGGDVSDRTEVDKACAALQRKGFSFSQIRQALTYYCEQLDEQEDSIQKEDMSTCPFNWE